MSAGIEAAARRLHAAHERRRKGPWANVRTPWALLTDDERAEYLGVAANIHAALYAADGDAVGAAEQLAEEYHGRTDAPEVIAYWHDRLTEYMGD